MQSTLCLGFNKHVASERIHLLAQKKKEKKMAAASKCSEILHGK
jgi:hypothetical protein